MIEQAMIFALGFLVAGLIALAIAPAFWRRALRLSTRRLEMAVPLSGREIIAERDLLRAEFAVDRRKFEQEAEGLRALRFADMAQLGRRATELVAKDAAYAALAARHAEQGAELIASRRAHAEDLAQLAVAASALYGDEGLRERKDAELAQLRADLARAQALAATQSAALADFEAQLARERANLTAARAHLARFSDALDSLRLEREADLATLRATAAQLADRESALRAAENRETELQEQRRRQIETARAAELRLVERIGRTEAAEAAARQGLAVAEARAESLALEIADLRRAGAPRDSAATTEQEENAILRQSINEIGAAIVRAAGLALEPAPAAQAQARIDDGEAGSGAEPDVSLAAPQRHKANRL